MKTINGNLILEKDTVFDEDLKVKGHITCKGGNWYNLTVKGNINAGDINAWDINAWDINAGDIICENRKKKTKTAKTVARVFITGRSKLERKEWKV